MSDTALDHPLVRDYLRQLAAELSALPPARAAELQEQIKSHLDEELPPDATDEDVTEAIRRLGTPVELARDAGAQPRRTLSAVLRKRSRRFWIVLVSLIVALAAAGIPIGLLVSVETAPTLFINTLGGVDGGWWYPQDEAHQATTTFGYEPMRSVPVRWNQRQGFEFRVWNLSGYTQTVLGYAPGTAKSPGNPGHAQLRLSGRDASHYPAEPYAEHYSLPVSIPPHQSRYLRVLWIQDDCLQIGASQSIDHLTLRVRVGWITRTETISLGEMWGVQARSACKWN